MKYLILCMIYVGMLNAQDILVKSLKTFTTNNRNTFPVLELEESSSKLIIKFDVESTEQPDIAIRFKFCNSDWEPYSSGFFTNNGYNIDNMPKIEILSSKIKGADYHYRGKYPNENVTFPFFGKWKFEIIDLYDETIFAEGKFVVAGKSLRLKTKITADELDGIPYSPAVLNHTLRFSTDMIFPDTLETFRIKKYELIENFKVNDSYVVNLQNTTNTRYYESDGFTDYQFVVRDVRPGNEYRHINITNITKYPCCEVPARYDGPDVPRMFGIKRNDLNGTFRVLDYSNTYSDYMWVKFQLKTEEALERDVFLSGSFSDWNVWPEYKMEFVDGYYELEVELKRGEYDYQYATGIENINKVLDVNWFELEGNSRKTENNYYIFIFYEDPQYGGYDRLIGYQKIKSGKYEQY